MLEKSRSQELQKPPFPRGPADTIRIRRLLLSAGVSFLIYLLTSGLAPAPRLALTIFGVAAMLWITEAVPLYVTSFIILFLEVTLLGLPGGPLGFEGSEYKAFLQPFFDPTITLFMGGFALSAALSRYRLDALLASAILRRLPPTPGAVLAGFMAATVFLSMWMSNTATTALMLAVMLPVLGNIAESDPWRRALVLAIPFSANLGGMGTPVGSPPNVIALGALQRAGVEISFIKWMAIAVPVMLLMLFFTWFLLMRFFPPQSGTVLLTRAGQNNATITTRGWFVLATFIGTALLWLTSAWHGIPEGIVGLIPVILLFGSKTLSTENISNLGWDVLLIVGGGLSLSVAFQQAGLPEVIADLLPTAGMPIWQLLVLMIALTSLLGTFISNTATAGLLMPIVIGLCAGHPAMTAITVATTLAISMVMTLPISTPPNTMAYGTRAIGTADMARTGLLINLAGMALLVLAGSLLWRLVI